MRRSTKRQVYSAVTRFGGTHLGRRVALVVESLDRSFKNDNSDHRTNGESWLLSTLAPLHPVVVLDVGANHGTWSSVALATLPHATVHAFEPVPATYEHLGRRVGASSRLVIQNAALTAHDAGQLKMWTGRHDTLASAVLSPVNGGNEVVVESMTGDTYCATAGIEHIDLLKVDTEGHDLDVLHGFSSMLERGCVDVIQFEFTLFAVFARIWLRDFCDLLEPLGYSIGKLYPTWIAWKDYDAHDERFLRCNFVAVRSGSSAARMLGADPALRTGTTRQAR